MVDFPMGAILFFHVLSCNVRTHGRDGCMVVLVASTGKRTVSSLVSRCALRNRIYPRRCAGYFEQEKTQPPFQDNTQLPTEKIGGMRMPLRIDFVAPEEFGFSRLSMKKNNIPLIVCGHVGAFNGLIWHTEMAHIIHQTQDGLLLTSRFWLGRTMNPLLRKLMINNSMACGMAEHCAIEYRNLAEILPALYKKYK